jgi:tetratricopeptide (TPR) repeat protein
MDTLLDRLQRAIGDSYRIERELGGGGMSRVFLAEETGLERQVVVKVLPPEMAAGVNAERFRREILLAAKLQHPHVVPLLTAGASGDLLYYVMPFIKGESLRAKLAREGELPVGDAARILRDVADALAYAHREGVVHRDIKPDNVLLSDNHAVVTDFGVAKAVASSTGESSLTSLGVALGTPAYMSPEQAVADPHVDHRADIYALGALAYEMLTGRPPFTGATPQAVLSAHVTQIPDPVTQHRGTVPPALAEIVMRCLAKKPADRWQRADELRAQFESMVTPSGGLTPTGTQPVPAINYGQRARKTHPARVGALFGLAAVGMAAIVYVVVQVVGLPSWVFWSALGLLAVGFPLTLLSGYLERRRALALATGVHPPTPSGLRRHLTLRHAVVGAGAAFAALTVLTGAYMAMRTLGVGPVGTLVASGAIDTQAPIVLADFQDRTGDSTLGSALTEAIRVDLSQSKVVRLLSASDVAAALERMRRAPGTPLEPETARELAVREGAGAVITGEINRAGTGFVLTASIATPDSGTVLAAFRETAATDADVIGAIDRLSRAMRERIGDSFRTLRAQGSLARVSTSSLEALRKYSLGLKAEQRGDFQGAVDLFEGAVALDSDFAMAWRKLGVVLSNSAGSRTRELAAVTRAYELRDRLPELERYQTTGFYFLDTGDEPERTMAIYREALERFPHDPTLLTNGAYAFIMAGRYAEAESLAPRGRAYGMAAWVSEVTAQLALGERARAESTMADLERAAPDLPFVPGWEAFVRVGIDPLIDVDSVLRPFADSTVLSLSVRAVYASALVANAALRGRFSQARADTRLTQRLDEQRGVPRWSLETALYLAELEQRYVSPDAGHRIVDSALARHPLRSLEPLDRPYLDLAEVLADVGDPVGARRMVTEWEQVIPEGQRHAGPDAYEMRASIALAEGRPGDAVTEYERRLEWDGGARCPACVRYALAEALDAAGQTDSAVAVWEQALGEAAFEMVFSYALSLPHAYQRLGEIYEQRGNKAKALDYYGKFVELWKNADPELQPVVRDVRERMARLTTESR